MHPHPSISTDTNHVKIYEFYSLSKDASREEEILWLIKCTRQGSLSNVGHFNTPLTCGILIWLNTCSTTRRKYPSLSKEPALIPCKSLWTLLTLKRRIERGRDTITYKVYKTKISNVRQFNKPQAQ